MVRYGFSLILGILFLLLTILTSGSKPNDIYDLPSLILTVALPFILMYILNGNTGFRMAFRAPFKKNISKEQLLNAKEFFTFYSITTWLSGISAVLIGTVVMLKYVEDKMQIGPNMALALMSLLYAALINVLVIIPFKILINKKIKEIV
jgi:flagellar motor component MotA